MLMLDLKLVAFVVINTSSKLRNYPRLPYMHVSLQLVAESRHKSGGVIVGSTPVILPRADAAR